MRIAFDVSPLSHPRTGVGNNIRGSLLGLTRVAGDEDEIIAFAPTSYWGSRWLLGSVDGIPVERRIVRLPASHMIRQSWSRLGRPSAERFLGRFDVLHFWDWMFPPQRSGLRVTTIHDLVPLHFPEWVQWRTRRMHGAKYRHAARACDLVFAISEFTAQDVVEQLEIPRERIRVAYPGVDHERFRPDGERADLGRPYILTAATLEPRKNLETLLAAHELLGGEPALAIAGAEGWGDRPELDRPGVIRLGYVSDDELARLYRGALCVVYPSRFEGFGLPVVEAMASGVPAVASAHPSIDEAAGDVAVRADPESPEDLAAAIERAIAQRDRLVPGGIEHGRRFTWEETGRALLAGYREFVG